MTSAKEIFVVQLGRASRKANRFIRRLPREAREDVLAIAVLWCWENRDSYSLVTSLDTWFVGAVRNAYRDWLRGERRSRAELVSEMRSDDDPEYNAVLAEAVRTLADNMDEVDRAIVQLKLDGEERPDHIAGQLGIDRANVYRRLARMRAQIPAGAHEGVTLRRAVTPRAPNHDDEPSVQSEIDRELEKLDMPPEHGKDCPPCWRCKYFEGYLPGEHMPVRMDIQERSVKAAVLWTERRKKRIAREVRDGLI
jgi:RNA polymerase sigma factor (sigma-70 family)